MGDRIDLKRAFVAERERYVKALEQWHSGQWHIGDLDPATGKMDDRTQDHVAFLERCIAHYDQALAWIDEQEKQKD